ncbi:MAG: AMIN domain-containing protein, partial [Desulfuromonadales bacterium]|nr:AMIN domain-containing protein [Desulfuromonadales bacterium]
MQLSTVLRSGGKTGITLAAAGFLVCSVLAATGGGATTPEKGVASEANKLVSVVARQDGGEAVIEVQSANPVGYRYTAYDSLNPVRIVIDFPDMEVADAKLPGNLPLGAVREVRTGTLELTSGKLGRVELLLEKETRYQISTNGTQCTVRFAPKTAATTEGKPAVAPAAAEPKVAVAAVPPAARP